MGYQSQSDHRLAQALITAGVMTWLICLTFVVFAQAHMIAVLRAKQ